MKKIDPFLSDEPTLAPPSPGAAIVRLSQVLGELRQGKANLVPKDELVPEWSKKIEESRADLLQAVEQRQDIGAAFSGAQTTLRGFYAALVESQPDATMLPALLKVFGFPDPFRSVDDWVHPVDVDSVVLSHFMPERQVFSSFSFDEAPGATAYWLWEVRFFEDQRLEDAIVENYAPQFSRIRLPVGEHSFFIESRNRHRSVRSAEFQVTIPQL